MIQTQENKTKGEIESSHQFIGEEWKKYNKRMDDIIDDVVIEAEIEAEKAIRSKNSKLVTISTIGIVVLILLFMKIQQHSNQPQSTIDKKTLIEKAAIIPQKKPLPNSEADNLTPATRPPMAMLTKISAKPKNITPQVIGGLTPKNTKTGKSSKFAPLKQTTNTHGGKHFIQLGAFSIKKNAENFSKKVRSKGFSTALSIHKTRSIRHHVFIGSFSRKNEAESKQSDLKTSGFTTSIAKIKNAYALELGSFLSDKDSNMFAGKLRDQGFKPKIKKVAVEDKTYTVRVEGLSTKIEAQKTRQKLADHGFKNSFIR